MIDKIISHYRIIEELGRGGMGEVFLAEDTKLRRCVALKFLPPELTRDPESKERFVQEAQAAAALNHPNIVTIHEINEHEGRIYIAMEYVEGRTLKDMISVGAGRAVPLPMDQAIDIAVQVAEGLAAAHKKGIIHRDIKPQNIIITKDNHVKILDFGLAKLKGVSPLTKESSTLGTVAYMSPEQAMGKEVDQRTDIWSLGVVLYEMLTGELPFKGDYDQALIYAILNEEPAPVSSLRRGLSPQWDWIIGKMMAKNYFTRYHQAGDVIADLQQLIPESKTRTRTGRISPKESIRRPNIWKYAAWILFGMALVVVAYFILIKPQAKPFAPIAGMTEEIAALKPQASEWKNSVAVLPFEDLSPKKDQEYFCDGMTEEIISRLSRIRDLKVTSRTSAMRYKKSEKTIREIGADLGVGNILEGSIRREKQTIRVTAQLIRVSDDSHLWSVSLDDTLDSVFRVQNRIAQAIAEKLQVGFSPTALSVMPAGGPKSTEAYDYCLQGFFWINSRFVATLSETDFKQALGLFRKALALDPGYAFAYNGLGYAYLYHYYTLGYYQKPDDLDASLNYYQKAYHLDPDSAESNGGIAFAYLMKKDYDRAFVHFRRALDLNSNSSMLLSAMGEFYYQIGLFHQALPFFSRAAALDPYLLNPVGRPAYIYMFLNDFTAAVPFFQRALELSPYLAPVYGMYARLLIANQRLDEAEAILARGEKINPREPYILHFRSLFWAAKGEKAKALAAATPDAMVYALLNMKEEAIGRLSATFLSLSVDECLYLELLNNPFYTNIRNDPRFQAFLEKLKKTYLERVQKFSSM